MQTDRYFYIATLPALGGLGSAPPMGLADLIEHVEQRERWQTLVGALVLMDDLLQREAFLAGEIEDVEPAVLGVQQVRGETPLPDYLTPEEHEEGPVAVESDRLWATYFHYATEVGRRMRSKFLPQWVAFEVALRNALAAARARRLGLEEHDYLVATHLADEQADLSGVVSEWEAATTPLAGLRVIIRARWQWIEQHDAWFTFSEDELLVHAARVMLLEQWKRTEQQTENS